MGLCGRPCLDKKNKKNKSTERIFQSESERASEKYEISEKEKEINKRSLKKFKKEKKEYIEQTKKMDSSNESKIINGDFLYWSNNTNRFHNGKKFKRNIKTFVFKISIQNHNKGRNPKIK